MMLPGAVTLIPRFLIFRYLGWLDSFLPLIVPYWFGGTAFSIFLLRQFFMNIPHELDEAARMDGASSLQIARPAHLPEYPQPARQLSHGDLHAPGVAGGDFVF
jgi:ABC-type glycerol-3-phosphate transport system permease component